MRVTNKTAEPLQKLKSLSAKKGTFLRFFAFQVTLENLCTCGDPQRGKIKRIVYRIIHFLRGKGWINQKKAYELLKQNQNSLQERIRKLPLSRLNSKPKVEVEKIAATLKRIFPFFSFPDYLLTPLKRPEIERTKNDLRAVNHLILIVQMIQKKVRKKIREQAKDPSGYALFRTPGRRNIIDDWVETNKQVNRPSFNNLSLDDLSSILKHYLLEMVPTKTSQLFCPFLDPFDENIEKCERAILSLPLKEQTLLKKTTLLLIDVYNHYWKPKKSSLEDMLKAIPSLTNIVSRENLIFMISNYSQIFPFQNRSKDE